MPGAWAYARVESAAETVRAALPDFIGSDGARLVFRGPPQPVGPPAGSARIAARWQVGRSSGDADVLLFPVSADLCEVHLTLRSPPSLTWRGTRLTTLAQDLVRAIAAATVRRPSYPRPTSIERESLASRWAFRPASDGSAFR
jgi:hypothetical protein